ncbi:MAG: undecaprenyldiphospho-muramoylpentapeptide beta-N-acetylglucosaminyltransferase [Desulfovibrio sp.]|nr:undecaprenyldiphospho-muramoylpentapeptide beta-N-acetylglucosaminyltransferase [Desulfovibrio sp.]
MKSVILAAGGTGGHIFPALAVAEELRRRFPDLRLKLAGSRRGPEKEIAAGHGIAFEGLPVRGFLGRGPRAAAAGVMMTAAVIQAVGMIRQWRPQVVLGFGGYASFAPVAAAALCGVPCVLHEQNAVAGTSNRFVSRFARRVCLSWPDTTGFPPQKCVLTGNPVRRDICAVGGSERRFSTRRLLVLGGSQGAKALNDFMPKILPALTAAGVEIRHQSGRNEESAVKQAYAQAGCAPECVSAFIDDMARAYAWADLVICRAGASTAAELCAAGLPCILVPFPHAANDHQTRNARILEKYGMATAIRQSDLDADSVAALLLEMFADEERRKRMSRAALKMARADAAARVLAVLEETRDMREKRR